METTKIKETVKVIIPRIPEELVYETINGKPIYYKNYKKVINQKKQIEEIMGCSNGQAYIIDCIIMFLHDNLDRNIYKIASNELGLHLNSKNNLAADIAIFEKSKIYSKSIAFKYEKIAPEIIIEIDTKADLNDFDNVMDYYQVKTEKLFKFGVKKVLWVLTKNKHIIEAEPDKPWLIKKWNYDIDLINDLKFNLQQLLKEDGIFNLL